MSTSHCTVCVQALMSTKAARNGGLIPCIAGSSRAVTRALPPASFSPVAARTVSTAPLQQPEAVPFFGPPYRPTPPAYLSQSGKRRSQQSGKRDDEDMEKEVDDREWEIRVGAFHALLGIP